MASGLEYRRKPVTDIFTPKQTDINRLLCKRTVPMRVLALGLPRTGTSSLRAALKQLGYEDTYHMRCAKEENPPDCLMWQDAVAAKFDGKGKFGREEWDQLLGHCQAVSDFPAILFAKELIEAYPEAKIIMTTRDIDSWYTSMMKTVNWRPYSPLTRTLVKVDWNARLYYPMMRRSTSIFFGDFEKQGKQRFIDYYDEIRSIEPPVNLLEFRVTSTMRVFGTADPRDALPKRQRRRYLYLQPPRVPL